jgi:hypothetical protein
MTNTLPERTAAPLELTREIARQVRCPHCGRGPGVCCLAPHSGCHLARFAEARRQGLLIAAEMDAVLAKVVVLPAGTIVRAGAR